VESWNGESGVLDRRGGVAAGVTAACEMRPDRGVESALGEDQAGRVGADVFEDAQLPCRA